MVKKKNWRSCGSEVRVCGRFSRHEPMAEGEGEDIVSLIFLLRGLCMFLVTCVTNHHKLNGLKTQIYFLTVLESRALNGSLQHQGVDSRL